MTEFIVLTGHTDHYSISKRLDEHTTTDEAVEAFAHFLLGMGYAVEAIAASLEKMSSEL